MWLSRSKKYLYFSIDRAWIHCDYLLLYTLYYFVAFRQLKFSRSLLYDCNLLYSIFFCRREFKSICFCISLNLCIRVFMSCNKLHNYFIIYNVCRVLQFCYEQRSVPKLFSGSVWIKFALFLVRLRRSIRQKHYLLFRRSKHCPAVWPNSRALVVILKPSFLNPAKTKKQR